MTYRYFEVHALGLNRADVRFDKDGAGYSYSSLIRASGKAEAEAAFRKDKRFRRMATLNNEDWREVPVFVDECPQSEFARDIRTDRPVSYRRSAFLKRVSR
jgi:hypothetical protein